MSSTGEQPGVALNLFDVPPWVIASESFNIDPRALRLAGVRESNRHFFKMIEGLEDPEQRGATFHDYLAVKFSLHEWSKHEGQARRSLRNSYVRFLIGWGIDSNGVEGAVLKSWVESRFGIRPTYHRGRLTFKDGEEDQRFSQDRMRGSMRTNAIFSQLDLLYEFCQYELFRRWPQRQTMVLFRGTNDPEEHPVIDRREKRESCVRLNNLCSFTSDSEKAWEFGSTVWRTSVACSKILFFSGLLPNSILRGEDEFLVVGGNYWVREILY